MAWRFHAIDAMLSDFHTARYVSWSISAFPVGEEDERTLRAANNYASSLIMLERFEEGKALLLKAVSAARRVLGDNDRLTFRMRWCYAMALYDDPAATLDDLREAKTRLEELAPYARRVLGGAHPLTTGIEHSLKFSREALRARDTPSSSA